MTQPAVPPVAVTDAVPVRLRRRTVDRIWGSIVAMHVVLVLAVLAAVVWVVSLDGVSTALAVTPFVIILIGELFQLAMAATLWHGLRSVPEPLVVSGAGLVLRSRQGEVSCPWEAVTAVRVERRLLGRLLRVRLHPAAGPGSPGVSSTLSKGGWRAVHGTGMRYAMRILDVSEPDLRALVAERSGGRVVVT